MRIKGAEPVEIGFVRQSVWTNLPIPVAELLPWPTARVNNTIQTTNGLSNFIESVPKLSVEDFL